MRRSALHFVLVAALALGGCLSARRNLVRVSEVDGSNDHRIFRIGAVTKLMMEPVLWQLEDAERINFDRPVTLYFKDRLPPEFDHVTLRMLHDGLSGLPDHVTDAWCLEDDCRRLGSELYGCDFRAGFDTRATFVRKLWDPRLRGDVRRGEPRPSNVGYALMMMAIIDELGETPENLLDRYVVRPYGLSDTSFLIRPDLQPRLTPACAGSRPWLYPAGCEVPVYREGDVTPHYDGLLSSASDILKVCFVVMPHLDRARGIFSERWLKDGRKIRYLRGSTYGGHAFVGFDVRNRHAVVVLENKTRYDTSEGFALFESLVAPGLYNR